MSRCIDADALLKAIIQMSLDGNVFDRIHEAPTIEPQRKKGKWQITEAYPHNVYCSECHKKFAQTHWAVWEDGSLPRNFCPNCGTDMRTPVETARDIVHTAIDNSVWSDTVDVSEMHKVVDDKYAEMEGQDERDI